MSPSLTQEVAGLNTFFTKKFVSEFSECYLGKPHCQRCIYCKINSILDSISTESTYLLCSNLPQQA